MKKKQDKNNIIPLFNDQIFGTSSGIIVMLSLIYGLYIANAKRNSYIMALLAVLISDPISHTISQNIANNYHVPIGIDSFFSHIFINLGTLLCFFITKNTKKSVYAATIFNFITLFAVLTINNKTIGYSIISALTLVFVVIFSFLFNKLIDKYL
jgi:hypothetical protein